MIEATHPLHKGISDLQKWLDTNKLSANRFAIQSGIDPSILGKLMRGKMRRVSVELAYLIEKGTSGAVKYTAWLPTEQAHA